MKYAIYLSAFAIVLAITACGGDDEPTTCNTDNITYTNTVKAIIAREGCTDSGCHPANLSSQNFSLATYQDAINFNRKDKMIGALRWQAGFQQMPRDSVTQMGREMLPDCDIDKIEAWIADGRPE